LQPLDRWLWLSWAVLLLLLLLQLNMLCPMSKDKQSSGTHPEELHIEAFGEHVSCRKVKLESATCRH
jgi:hypothetical protein